MANKKTEKLVGSADQKDEAVKAKNTVDENVSSEKQTSLNVKRPNNNESEKKTEEYYKEKSLDIENGIRAKLDANPAVKALYKEIVSVSKLMETGAHIGLQSKKWNPKMKKYIYAKKGKNHIIDLYYTMVGLSNAYNFLNKLGKENKKALFVGTKGKIIKNHIKQQSRRVGSFFVNQRWLGGTLTNFKTICNSTKKFNELVAQQKFGNLKEKYSKKEQIYFLKKIEKLNKFFGGIRTMTKLPDVLIVIDPVEEKNAVLEAKKLNIPVIAICNTNANPDNIDIVIPANNYSIKSIYLIVGLLADAIASGANKPLEFIGKKIEINFQNMY